MAQMSGQNYRRTIYSCFMGYVVQAVVNNFAPLLFLTFQDSFGLPLSRITALITFNFAVQLVTDFLSSFLVGLFGVRLCLILAHAAAGAGLICMGVLPGLLAAPFAGLVISVMVYAVGGALIEVLISPVVESCPTGNKEAAMSLLHSFYCWGHASVIVVSTLYFRICGIGNWRFLAFIFAAFSFLNGISFISAPLAPFTEEGNAGMKLVDLFKNRMFWVLMLMMVCAGAAEQTVSQWASAFAESALSLSKTAGDLAGPLMFALLMGASRAFYGRFGTALNLKRFMALSTALCVISYSLIVFSPYAQLSLAGCALAGLSVGIMWPGTLSRAAAAMKNGGASMFAMLALAGDAGCGSGPTLAGFISSLVGGNLRAGICAALVFPVIMLVLTASAGCGKKIV